MIPKLMTINRTIIIEYMYNIYLLWQVDDFMNVTPKSNQFSYNIISYISSRSWRGSMLYFLRSVALMERINPSSGNQASLCRTK